MIALSRGSVPSMQQQPQNAPKDQDKGPPNTSDESTAYYHYKKSELRMRTDDYLEAIIRLPLDENSSCLDVARMHTARFCNYVSGSLASQCLRYNNCSSDSPIIFHLDGYSKRDFDRSQL